MTASPEPAPARDTPVLRHLGIAIEAPEGERCVARMAVREEFLQDFGVVQGGILTALADEAAVSLLLPHLTPGRAVTSIELKQNFLRPALAGRGELVARARTVRRGRTVAVVACDVEQAGEAVTTGVFTYLFFDRPVPPTT